METLCELCGLRAATVYDPASTSGAPRWCAICATRRQATRAALPYLGAALGAAAMVVGGALLVERLSDRGSGEGPKPFEDLTRRFRFGTPTLSAYSRDLTDLARNGKLDPVIGRQDEVERVISILARRSKNNPV
ncbi:MAG: ATP-dependent Clp protease ATP-binding subunit, partial [Candidatus Eremiobacteraeota bacterium]|nr:ATP-dependent Clp protease ATP-binding subunit [Candidatus Eremiobacteraeota bacterium]